MGPPCSNCSPQVVVGAAHGAPGRLRWTSVILPQSEPAHPMVLGQPWGNTPSSDGNCRSRSLYRANCKWDGRCTDSEGPSASVGPRH